MNDLTQFGALAALIIGGFGLFAFMFTRLEHRMDRFEERMDQLAGHLGNVEQSIPAQFENLRRDLAEEFRAQRAEVAQQITAITNAIIASRKD
jgi:hypothetical protein